jgi:acetylornithine deacetylase/succinyl-diaminopimelate desuccinylase-like protein
MTEGRSRLERQAVQWLQALLRFDTTNPPGHEAPCIEFIEDRLARAGLETRTLAQAPDRPNLIARLPGRRAAPPLLLYGHVDVVPADPRHWTHPPFSGLISDGCVWGRGALDMKGGVAMMLTALEAFAASGVEPAGDLLFAAVADEEAGGDNGARFLVEEHPTLFSGVRHAIGEFGGFPLRIAGRTVYPVQVAEKSPCLAKLIVRGAGGHGSGIVRGRAMMRAATLLRRLDRARLPVAIPDATAAMIRALADSLPGATGWLLRGLLHRRLAGPLLRLLGPQMRILEPLLRDTATPTVIAGGGKPNVVPQEIHVTLDCRLLPGSPSDRFLDRLRSIVGPEVQVTLDCLGGGSASVDRSLLPLLAEILAGRTGGDPVVPLLLPASTDARHFARLGIQSYGFTPMDLPPSFPFLEMIHATDERIPTGCLEFGAGCMLELLRRYGAHDVHRTGAPTQTEWRRRG